MRFASVAASALVLIFLVRDASAANPTLFDLVSGPDPSAPGGFMVVEGHVYFRAWTKGTGVQLLRIDEGATQIDVLATFPPKDGGPATLAPLGQAGTHFFFIGADSRLWSTTSVPGTAVRISDSIDTKYSGRMAPLGDRAVVGINGAPSSASGTLVYAPGPLVVSDGVTSTTLAEGAVRTGPATLGGYAYFAGADGKLNRTDGATTAVFKDMAPATGISAMKTCGDYVYFLTTGTNAQNSLWRTDGTPEGTIELTPGGGKTGYLRQCLGSALYWVPMPTNAAGSGNPWTSDGSLVGTKKLSDALVSDVDYRRTVKGKTLIFFMADGTIKTDHIYATDLTPANTKIIVNSSSTGLLVTAIDDTLYFGMSTGLYSATVTETKALGLVNGGQCEVRPQEGVAAGTKIFSYGACYSPDTGTELNVFDTTQPADTVPSVVTAPPFGPPDAGSSSSSSSSSGSSSSSSSSGSSSSSSSSGSSTTSTSSSGAPPTTPSDGGAPGLAASGGSSDDGCNVGGGPIAATPLGVLLALGFLSRRQGAKRRESVRRR